MVAEDERGRACAAARIRATTQFCLTDSVVMLEPGKETGTRSEQAARDGLFEALV